MGILNVGSNTVSREYVKLVLPTSTGETVEVAHNGTLPSLKFLKGAKTVDVKVIITGDYDCKPNKKNQATVKKLGYIDILGIGQDALRAEPPIISKDGKTITYVINNSSTIGWLSGDETFDWYLSNNIIPTPTEILKEYFITPLGSTDHYTSDLEGNKVTEGRNTIIFKANEGYEFKEKVTITGMVSKSFNDDMTELTLVFDVSENIDYNIEVQRQLPYYSITYNVENCTYTGETKVREGTDLTIKLTADKNHFFIDKPTITDGYFTINNNKTGATIALKIMKDTVVNAAATRPVYTTTFNLENCFVATTQETYLHGDSAYINIKTNEGFEFIETPTYTMGSETGNLSKHTKSAEFVGTVTGDLVITAKAKVPAIYYKITERLTDLVSDNTDTLIEENTHKIINYTTEKENFLIDNITTNIGTVTINDNLRSAVVEFNTTGDIIIIGKAVKKSVISITGTFENCKCNYKDGEMFNKTKPIIITANKGYEFVKGFRYRNGASTHTFTNVNETTLNADASDGGDIIVLFDDYRAVKQVVSIGSFSHLYNPTGEQLTQLSKKRFVTGAEQLEDYGQYISNLYFLPFRIPTDLLGDETSIILGNFDTKVTSTRLSNYTFTVDLGTIRVNEKYNNVYDYINTDYILHAPFFTKTYLNSEYVINQEINVKMVIDLYSGSATMNVYSSFTGGIIESFKSMIGSNIPFIQNNSNSAIGLLSNVDNFVDNVYIEVVRNKPYNVNTFFGGETIEYGKIKDYQNFIRCDNIVLNTKATNIEKEEIKKLLKEGVIL